MKLAVMVGRKEQTVAEGPKVDLDEEEKLQTPKKLGSSLSLFRATEPRRDMAKLPVALSGVLESDCAWKRTHSIH